MDRYFYIVSVRERSEGWDEGEGEMNKETEID